MTPLRTSFVCAAAVALTFGLQFPDPKLIGGPSPLPNEDVMVFAANEQTGQPQAQAEDNADESAKMGEESGTQTGN
jgi:hypothetical protein